MKSTIALLVLASLTTSYATEFKEVVARPRAFHDKVISLTGLAHVNGDRFYLYESVSAASKTDHFRAIYVRQRDKVATLNRFDNRWVRLTGKIDAEHHGPLVLLSSTGKETGGLPCEMSLQKAELLDRPPEQQWPIDLGRFKNATKGAVRVFLSNEPNRYYGIFTLGPGGVNSMAVRPNTVAVVTLLEKEPSDLVPEEMQIAKAKLPITPRTQTRDEPAKRIFYYCITEGKIESVPAKETRDWLTSSEFDPETEQ